LPVVVALEIMDFPNYGTVIGDELYFFANSHWGSGDDSLKPVTIASVSLSATVEIISLDAERFLEQYKNAQALGRVKPAPGQESPAIENESNTDEAEKDDGGS